MVGNSLLVGVGSSIKNSHKRKKTYTISPHQTYSLWLANRLALSEVRLLWFMHMVIMIYCCIHFCNYNHIKFTSISPSITYHYTVSKNMTSNLACIIWVNIIINRQMNNPSPMTIKIWEEIFWSLCDENIIGLYSPTGSWVLYSTVFWYLIGCMCWWLGDAMMGDNLLFGMIFMFNTPLWI